MDSDEDGITDNLDIDSDNDGITDNEEWQKEGKYIKPLETDSNKNGWDDAYDIELNGVYYEPVDTNENGVPDFIDTDSDGDGSTDNLEAFDTDNDGIIELSTFYIDNDKDGLNDIYDLISCWSLGCNSIGSNAPLPDLDNNGIRDWRDSRVKVGNYLGTSAFEIITYPNPSNGNFTISIPLYDENSKLELKLYNLLGIEIYREMVNSGESEVNVENAAPGNYILQINAETEKYQSIVTIR